MLHAPMLTILPTKLSSLAFAGIILCVHASLEQNQRHLSSFDFDDLQNLAWETRARLHYALRTEGAILVTGMPGYSETVADALDEFDACLHSVGTESDSTTKAERFLRRVLPDGTERLTLATVTEGGSPQPLSDRLGEECPHLGKPVSRLRAVVSLLLALFGKSVDETIQGPARATKGSGSSDSPALEEMVRKGKVLEHFHHYAQSSGVSYKGGAPLDQPALRMHTDVGLFQALSVRWRHARGSEQRNVHGLRDAYSLGWGVEVQFPSGAVVPAKPLAKPQGRGGDGILILLGQGIAEWLPHLQLRPAPHALTLGSSTAQVYHRLVYGVMVLPPEDWLLPGLVSADRVSFGVWWRRAQFALTGTASNEADVGPMLPIPASTLDGSDGCLSHGILGRRLQDLSQSCGAGEIFCWMQCAPAAHLACGDNEPVCMSDQTGKICPAVVGPDHVHDASCAPQCPKRADGVAGTRPGNGFCNGVFTDMHMLGFVWSGEENACLIFLFPGLELTDAAKLWTAAAVTFLGGAFAEYLVKVRRCTASLPLRRKGKSTRARAWWYAQSIYRLALYTLGRTLGYGIMLVSMTYSAELFIAVLLGLSAGHACFNLGEAAGDDLTACCQSQAQVPGRTGKAQISIPVTPGGSAQSTRVLLAVTGMTCNACVDTVKRAAETVDDLRVVELSLAKGQLELDFRDGTPTSLYEARLRSVCDAIEDVGFGVADVAFCESPAALRGPPI